MDSPKPMETAAEEWLWSLEWAKAGRPGQDSDWTGIIKCLRDVAEAEPGESWNKHDCAAWADLIEALVGKGPAEPQVNLRHNARSAKTPTECCLVEGALGNGH